MKKTILLILGLVWVAAILSGTVLNGTIKSTGLNEEQKAQVETLYNCCTIWQLKTASGSPINRIAIGESNGKNYLAVGRVLSTNGLTGGAVVGQYSMTSWLFEIKSNGVKAVDEDDVPGLSEMGLLMGANHVSWDVTADKAEKIAVLEEAMLKCIKNKK